MEGECQCLSDIHRCKSSGREGEFWWTLREEREGNDLEVKRNGNRNEKGGEKRNKMARNRARFNFQRINLGNTYNSGGYESKDFLLNAKGIN